MGRAYQAVCKSCGHTFPASEGGGFSFESLRCDQCGEDTAVSHNDVWESYLAMLKGGNFAFPEPDGADGRTYQGEPITEGEFRRRVEAKAGICSCGGQFKFDAPLRCPACRSASVADDGTREIMFD
jgi:hypothetical protein